MKKRGKKVPKPAQRRRDSEPGFAEIKYPQGEPWSSTRAQSKQAKPQVGIQGRCVLNPDGVDVTQKNGD